MPARTDWPSPRYFAWLYSTEPQRPVLEALFNIESEVAGSLRAGLDHQVAHARLQWWREECERTAEAKPVHPLTRQLATASETSLAATAQSRPPTPALAGLAGFVDTAVWDLASATFETRRELTAYCERWAAAMGISVIVRHSATFDWRSLGAALRELEMLTNFGLDAHSGRLRIPLDELKNAGVDPGAIAKPPWPTALVTLLRQRHEALRAAIAHHLSALHGEDQPALRGWLVWTVLARLASRRAQQDLPETVRLRPFDAIADAWLAWRAARRATIGRF